MKAFRGENGILYGTDRPIYLKNNFQIPSHKSNGLSAESESTFIVEERQTCKRWYINYSFGSVWKVKHIE